MKEADDACRRSTRPVTRHLTFADVVGEPKRRRSGRWRRDRRAAVRNVSRLREEEERMSRGGPVGLPSAKGTNAKR